MNNFFAELKRRNVVRIGIAYGVVTWVLLQGIDVVGDIMNLPDWVGQGLLIVLAVGFPLVLFFSWAFEVTPKGVMKTADVDKSKSITHGTGQKINKLIIGGLVLAVAFLLVDKFFISNNGGELRQAEAGQASIAVLPFVNMSDDASNEYFADGLSEEILNVLAKVPDLKVAGRTSSFQFKGENLDLREIGKTLGVETILEGSVRKQGNRVRITAQLIRASDGFHMWSDTYDRNLEDIFAVQDEISAAIFAELSRTLGLSGQMKGRGAITTDIAAYDRYLEARTLMARRGLDNLIRAAQLLEEATQLDPNFAESWAVLAQVYSLFFYYYPDNPVEYFPRAEAAARRAIALKPDLATGYAGLADALRDQGDLIGAEAGYKRALALNPNEAEANSQYSQFLLRVGKEGEAQPYAFKAYELDPLSAVYAAVVGVTYHVTGDHENERIYVAKSRSLDNVGYPHLVSGVLALNHRDMAQAKEDFQTFGELGGASREVRDATIVLAGLLNAPDKARSFLRELLEASKNNQPDVLLPFTFWTVAAALGDNALAGEFIEFNLKLSKGTSDPQFFANPSLKTDPSLRKIIATQSFLLGYWKANGFPPGCRAVGEEDFICE